MSYNIDKSMRTNNAYLFVCRIFGLYSHYFVVIALAVGLIIGIESSGDKLLYGIVIFSLMKLSDIMKLLIRQMVALEGLMVSYLRVNNLCNIPAEGELRTEYDKSIGFK
jgi:hypothetical protein